MASHKPLNEQVMVITGASSGIGLTTALHAARRGARLVLIARSAETLKRWQDGSPQTGGRHCM